MSVKGGDSAAEPNVVRSIAEAAAGALAEFGFGSRDLELVSHYVNTVFRLTTESGSYAVRVHRAADRTENEVAGELAWLDALAREGIRVPRVRRTPDGQGIVLVAVPEESRKLPMTVLDWMPGRSIGAEKETHHFEKLGRMTAALHRQARAWRSCAKLERPRYDSRNVFQADVPARIAAALGAARAPPVNAALSTLQARLQKAEEQLGTGADVFGFIHGDLSFGNVLFDKEIAVPIDFDDCGFGYYLHDLAVPLAGAFGQRTGFEERYDAFVTGYRQILGLPGDLLAFVPVFLGLRSAQLIMAYAGQYPWSEGIVEQFRTWLRPALEASGRPREWFR